MIQPSTDRNRPKRKKIERKWDRRQWARHGVYSSTYNCCQCTSEWIAKRNSIVLDILFCLSCDRPRADNKLLTTVHVIELSSYRCQNVTAKLAELTVEILQYRGGSSFIWSEVPYIEHSSMSLFFGLLFSFHFLLCELLALSSAQNIPTPLDHGHLGVLRRKWSREGLILEKARFRAHYFVRWTYKSLPPRKLTSVYCYVG